MAASLFHDVPLKAKVIGWGIIFIPLATLVLLGAIFLRPEAIDQRLVWGCYVARDAPPLDIREDAIYIIEPARRRFSYVAEPSKTSYQLNVRPALLLKREPTGRYAFASTQGTGFFWPLLPALGNNRDRVRHPQEFAGRIQVAADGADVVYSRTSDADACRR
ncbi:hypothetical protein [Sphingobium lignivorans]|uniref:DUF1254 domain-containing protein n=1 Tax=Sphingobium lignivorans TaxID=2735886 RepID=A0ABR6NFJ0_9SPHN|nr:hypothetical protein [Sphingobium lignivorans]MBB5985402.1 hypothetical protein [Sphingobium lignivorans]